MASFQLEFTESPSGNDIEAFRDLLADSFPGWSLDAVRQAPGAGGPCRGDPVAVAALILSIPSAILATWDLAQRSKLKEKVDRLIARAKERHARGQANPFLVPPGGTPVRVDEARADQVLDAIAAQARERPDRSP